MASTNKKCKVYIIFFGILLIILFVFILSQREDRKLYNNSIDNLLESTDIGYTKYRKVIYSTNPNEYVEILDELLFDYSDVNSLYFKSSNMVESLYVTVEGQEIDNYESYYVYNDEVSSYANTDGLWLKTIWHGIIGRPGPEVEQIKDIIVNPDYYEIVQVDNNQIYKFFEKSDEAIQNLEMRSCQINKVDNYIEFSNYLPFYLEVWIDEEGEIAKIDYSNSSVAYLSLLGTGNILRNDDGSFNSFTDGEFNIYSFDFNPEPFDLPVPDKTINRDAIVPT